MDYRQLRNRVEKYSTFSRTSRFLCKHPVSVKLMSWSSSTKRALSGFTAVCRKKESEPPRTRTWNLEIKASHDKEIIEENWQEELTERGNSCAGWQQVRTCLADDKNSE